MESLKYIELTSDTNLWKGSIYLKVLKETKCKYITKDYSFLNIMSSNYKDRSNNVIRWDKRTLYLPNFKVKKIWEHTPHVDDNRILD